MDKFSSAEALPAGDAALAASATRRRSLVEQVLAVVAGSLLVALCARISVPLPFTPVPLSLGNLGVLLAGVLLGSRAGAAALLLYLAEGSSGLPVFANGSLGLLGPTGGFLMAYPLVAFLAGWCAERTRSFARLLAGFTLAEILLFTAGVAWLALILRVPLATAAHWGLYPFAAGEVAKIVAAAALATRYPVRRHG